MPPATITLRPTATVSASRSASAPSSNDGPAAGVGTGSVRGACPGSTTKARPGGTRRTPANCEPSAYRSTPRTMIPASSTVGSGAVPRYAASGASAVHHTTRPPTSTQHLDLAPVLAGPPHLALGMAAHPYLRHPAAKRIPLSCNPFSHEAHMRERRGQLAKVAAAPGARQFSRARSGPTGSGPVLGVVRLIVARGPEGRPLRLTLTNPGEGFLAKVGLVVAAPGPARAYACDENS
ncbi:hypothetical protein ACFXB3_11210 [Streptomyces sp. NPDC059447]|uniref:hypothetical protein n=1 Tax=Streptomyces sp. NPDC059447 TaxID=3346834 RepID=UPI0036B1EE42